MPEIISLHADDKVNTFKFHLSGFLGLREGGRERERQRQRPKAFLSPSSGHPHPIFCGVRAARGGRRGGKEGGNRERGGQEVGWGVAEEEGWWGGSKVNAALQPTCEVANHFPKQSGFPGGDRSLEGGGQGTGWGIHLSLLGLLLPPAAASQPRAFPLPPDHIRLRGAEPRSPPNELESLGTNPGAALLVCVSVCLPLLSPSEGHLCSPPPFPLPEGESQPAEGALSRGSAASERLPQIPASSSSQFRALTVGPVPLHHDPP